VDWPAISGDFAGALAQSRRRGLARCDNRDALVGRRGVVGGARDVTFDVVGKHAQENLSAHPRRQRVADRAQLQIDGFELRKGSSTRARPL
jgi:hypothetical protein